LADGTVGQVIKTDGAGVLIFADDVAGTDEKVKYDAGDPTAGYVADKIIAGAGISVAEGVGGDENKLVITNDDKGSDVDLSGLVEKATLTTKGDIYVATGASTPVRFEVGADGEFLTADSTETTGLKWTNVSAGFKIVVSGGGTNKIYDAITGASAGDVVLVDAGVYAEENNIAVKSNVSVWCVSGVTINKTTAGALIDLDANDITNFSIEGFADMNSTNGIIKHNKAGNLNTTFGFSARDLTSTDASIINIYIANTAYTSQINFRIKFNNYTCSYATAESIDIYGNGSQDSVIKGILEYKEGSSTGHGGVVLYNNYRGIFDVDVRQFRTATLSATQYAVTCYIALAWTAPRYVKMQISGEWTGTNCANLQDRGTSTSKGIDAYDCLFFKGFVNVLLGSAGGSGMYAEMRLGSLQLATCKVDAQSIQTVTIKEATNSSVWCANASATVIIEGRVRANVTLSATFLRAMIYCTAGTIILQGGIERNDVNINNCRAFYITGGEVIIEGNRWLHAGGGGGSVGVEGSIITGGKLTLNNVQGTLTNTSGGEWSMIYLNGGTLQWMNTYISSNSNIANNHIVKVGGDADMIISGGFGKVVNASSYFLEIGDGFTLDLYIAGGLFTNSTINKVGTGDFSEKIVGGGTIVESIVLP
jgi:hypothetical protein